MNAPSREWLLKMAEAEDKCGGIISVGGLVTRFKQADGNERKRAVDPIDVEEAKNLSECCDCTAGIYVYNNGDFPADTGPICFNCLRKRYEKILGILRASSMIGPLETKRLLDELGGPNVP